MLYVVFVDYLIKWPEIFAIPSTSQLGVESSASVNKDKTNDKGGGSRSEWIGHLQSRQKKGLSRMWFLRTVRVTLYLLECNQQIFLIPINTESICGVESLCIVSV